MLVHPVAVPGSGTRSWTVLGDGDVPVVPVDRFLAYLTGIGRSPNTVKAYSHDLKDYWEFITFRGLDWREARLEDVGEFVAWLQLPPAGRARVCGDRLCGASRRRLAARRNHCGVPAPLPAAGDHRRGRSRNRPQHRRRHDEQRAGRLDREAHELLGGHDLEPVPRVEAPAEPSLRHEGVEHAGAYAPGDGTFAASWVIVAWAFLSAYQFVNADESRVSTWAPSGLRVCSSQTLKR